MKDEKKTSQDLVSYISAIAGGLAHEIKNPLSTIAVNLALLREDWSHPRNVKEERTVKKIALLEREVKRLETILNDFLRFAKGGELNLQKHDVNQLLQEVVDFVEPEARKHHVLIRAFFARDLPKIALDKDAFRQAILNVLVNAREAMPQGGELMIHTNRQKDVCEIRITDTGDGMGAEVLEHCFDVYFSRKRGGTGLGLPTAKRIVEAHSGSIEVQSQPGKGTQFLLRFPITK